MKHALNTYNFVYSFQDRGKTPKRKFSKGKRRKATVRKPLEDKKKKVTQQTNPLCQL